jgi:hypothetical protein
MLFVALRERRNIRDAGIDTLDWDSPGVRKNTLKTARGDSFSQRLILNQLSQLLSFCACRCFAQRAQLSSQRRLVLINSHMASESQGGQAALLGLTQRLAAGESRQITTGHATAAGGACVPSRPEALDIYW